MFKTKYQFATFVYPGWHPRPLRPEILQDRLFDEWSLLRDAKPLFKDHYQPRIPHPTIGYYDDSLIETSEVQIGIAKRFGIDIIIYLFYWNKGKRELAEPLDNCFLHAKNRDKIRFALMWCWKTPRRNFPVYPDQNALFEDERFVITDEDDFKNMLFLCIKKYFSQNNYWLIDGKPVLFLYTLQGFLKSLGEEKLKQILKEGNNLLKKYGFNGLYIFGITWDNQHVQRASSIGFNALSTYVYLPDFHGEPIQTYDLLINKRRFEWKNLRDQSSVIFYPSISPGWDGSPRGVCYPSILNQDRSEFPWTPIVTGGTPQRFSQWINQAVSFSNENEQKDKILFFTSWNEWSEGHHIEPDVKFGYSYLEEIKKAKELLT